MIELDELIAWLRDRSQDVDEATRIDRTALYERVKNALSAAQAVEAAALDAAVRVRHAARGMRRDKQGQGVGMEIALARRESPRRGNIHLGLAKALVAEMPHTLERMREGVLTEYRATILVRETGFLTREDRARIDHLICGDPAGFEGWSDKQFEREVKKLAYALEPEAVVKRHARAVSERHVSVRPAPDAMAYVTALVPMPQAVTIKACLKRDADAAKATGDERAHGQIEADRFVELLTGLATANEVPVTVNLVMTDVALLGGDCEPAQAVGLGPIPSSIARRWVKTGLAWIRRLYIRPKTGELVAMESRRRFFPAKLKQFLDIRDDVCRTPYCGAPIRHHDHILSRQHGGATSGVNGAGVSEGCNYTVEAPGFTAKPVDGERHAYELRTPTGHRYVSIAPKATGAA
ncbi:MAG: 13E12 repeat family protein [Nocardiaceae bacterium]|nr:13E12 repeat family protein [Nocardiaceae bacterium]